ncbi:MAG: hypothetical protein ABI318_20320 [Chthoniobacteraceae bacterium]
MKATRHTLPHATHTARRIPRCTPALAAMLLAACSATATKSKPDANLTERHGHVEFTSATENFEGDITIRHNANHFRAEITKGSGEPQLKLYASFGTDPKIKNDTENHMRFVHASGQLAHGSWSWRPRDLAKKDSAGEKLKDPSRAWAALPEVFMWGEAEAKGQPFRVSLPDIVIHARAGNGEVKRFDYVRHSNPTGEALPLPDLKKQPKLETVICHLD